MGECGRETLVHTASEIHILFQHTDEDNLQAEFVETMNTIAKGTPKDIQKATDDDTFERKSRDLVALYRWVQPISYLLYTSTSVHLPLDSFTFSPLHTLTVCLTLVAVLR